MNLDLCCVNFLSVGLKSVFNSYLQQGEVRIALQAPESLTEYEQRIWWSCVCVWVAGKMCDDQLFAT